MSLISVVILSVTFLYFSSLGLFILLLSFFRLSWCISYCKLCCLISVVSSDVILVEFINSIRAVSRNIEMANPPYLVGRKISTLS